ncbi:glycoside hydrolase family 3 protein [Bipolaris oryzae ATCC 44560]|uniref:beta-glucosidase n=1 Tax=Bipolaris oryzae ATCC 44560 TaxID=930090 RepID=W6Z998_COCMI|nr:glycoside hydrolase family 3 protein [Bipolaris oryzae ATCC 44560]EUC40256.1 glycoside hydrolase family 3 protein [Bipolaris oryzae ATCC 44560]
MSQYSSHFASLLSELTLEEKVTLISGRDFSAVAGVARLGIPPLRVAESTCGTGPGGQEAHFVGNDAETLRHYYDVKEKVNGRPLREIYLAAWYGHAKLYQDVLRGDCNFKGIVISDWFAVHDAVAPIKAGLDLEMPLPVFRGVQLVGKVKAGEVFEAETNAQALKMLELRDRTRACHSEELERSVISEATGDLARSIACSSMVLLENENCTLPVATSSTVALVGEFAKDPGVRTRCIIPMVSKEQTWAKSGTPGVDIAYHNNDSPEKTLMMDGKEIAPGPAILITMEQFIFNHILLEVWTQISTQTQTAYRIEFIMQGPEKLSIGEPTPYAAAFCFEEVIDHADAVLLAHFPGQEDACAAADLLTGCVSPSGKFATTWFKTLFPFGYGLTYRSFVYRGFEVSIDDSTHDPEPEFSVSTKDIGKRVAKDVVQVYITPPSNRIPWRPEMELKGFARTRLLAPGEEVTTIISIRLDMAFSYWDEVETGWGIEPGTSFEISKGKIWNHL